MGTLGLRNEQLSRVLDRLQEAVEDFCALDESVKSVDADDGGRVFRRHRDSMIQRFEFCVDLFWKYLKRYQEEGLKQKIDINAPKPVIRAACKARLLSEVDAETLIEMVNDRNVSSHIYKEEMADQISSRIAGYYELMRGCAGRLVPEQE